MGTRRCVRRAALHLHKVRKTQSLVSARDVHMSTRFLLVLLEVYLRTVIYFSLYVS